MKTFTLPNISMYILSFINFLWHRQGEFNEKARAFKVYDHFLNSHEPTLSFSSDTFVRN